MAYTFADIDAMNQTFAEMKDDLIARHFGKWALIMRSGLVGVYETQIEAAEVGNSYGPCECYLVKEIGRTSPRYWNLSMEELAKYPWVERPVSSDVKR